MNIGLIWDGFSDQFMKSSECIREKPWHIICRVTSQEGKCSAGHRVGDEILFTGTEVKGKICLSALYSMLPKVYGMMYNARFPWAEDPCKASHACPDPINPVVFELTRVEPD